MPRTIETSSRHTIERSESFDALRNLDNIKGSTKIPQSAERELANLRKNISHSFASLIEFWRHKDLDKSVQLRDELSKVYGDKTKSDKDKYQHRNIIGRLMIISTMRKLKDITIETLGGDKSVYPKLQADISHYFRASTGKQQQKAEIVSNIETIQDFITFHQPDVPENYYQLTESGELIKGNESINLYEENKTALTDLIEKHPDTAILLPGGAAWILAKNIDAHRTVKDHRTAKEEKKDDQIVCLNRTSYHYTIKLQEVHGRTDAGVTEREQELIGATKKLMQNRLSDLKKAIETDNELLAYTTMGEIKKASATIHDMTEAILKQRAPKEDPEAELQKMAISDLSGENIEDIQRNLYGNPLLQETQKSARQGSQAIGKSLLKFIEQNAPNLIEKAIHTENPFTSGRREKAYSHLDRIMQLQDPWRLERIDLYPDYDNKSIQKYLSDVTTVFRANKTAVYLLLPKTCATPYFSDEACPGYKPDCSKDAPYLMRALHALDIGLPSSTSEIERAQKKKGIEQLTVPKENATSQEQLTYAIQVSNIIAGRPVHEHTREAMTLHEPDANALEKEKMKYTVNVANLINGRDSSWGVKTLPHPVTPTHARTVWEHISRLVYQTKIVNILNGETQADGSTPDVNKHVRNITWIAMRHFTDDAYSTDEHKTNRKPDDSSDPDLATAPVDTTHEANLAFKLRIGLELQDKDNSAVKTQIQRFNNLDNPENHTVNDIRPLVRRRTPEVIKAMNSLIGKTMNYAEKISKLLQGEDIPDDNDLPNIDPMFVNHYYLSKIFHANLANKDIAELKGIIKKYMEKMHTLKKRKIKPTETPSVKSGAEMDNAIIEAQNQSIQMLKKILFVCQQLENNPELESSIRLSLMEIGENQKISENYIRLASRVLGDSSGTERRNSLGQLRKSINNAHQKFTFRMPDAQDDLQTRRLSLIELIDSNNKIGSSEDVIKRHNAIKQLAMVEQKLYFRQLQESDPAEAYRLMDNWASDVKKLEDEMRKKLDKEDTRQFIKEFTHDQFKKAMWLYAVMNMGSTGSGMVSAIDGVNEVGARALRELMRDLTK